MSYSPKVTVVSVFYNRGRYVRESVQSLINQSIDDVQIVLVDDGSTDDTLARLGEFGPADNRVKVVTGPNRGFTQAIRDAVAAATSPYIAIHGSGDVSFRERLHRQVAVLDARPDVGVVGCYVNNQAPTPGRMLMYVRRTDGDARAELVRHNVLTHGEAMFRRDIYEQAGGYRTFFTYAQDRDLWCRMSRLTHFYTIPEVLYERRRLPGVRSDAHKVIAQALFSHFAVHCHREVLSGRPDPLELLGPIAAANVPRSRSTSKRLARAAIAMAIRGDMDDARLAAAIARYHGTTAHSLLAAAMTMDNIRPFIPRAFITHFLARRLVMR